MGKMSDKDLEYKELKKRMIKIDNIMFANEDFVIQLVDNLEVEALINIFDAVTVKLFYSDVHFNCLRERLEMIIKATKREERK